MQGVVVGGWEGWGGGGGGGWGGVGRGRRVCGGGGVGGGGNRGLGGRKFENAWRFLTEVWVRNKEDRASQTGFGSKRPF